MTTDSLPAFNRLTNEIQRYHQAWQELTDRTDLKTEKQTLELESQKKIGDRFLAAMENRSIGYERDFFPGHLTGSAMILTPDLKRCLLTLHAKLNLWLQLGGHAEVPCPLSEAAFREAEEESGLLDLKFYDYGLKEEAPNRSMWPLIFDLDIHAIPARKQDPQHWHYDVRYVLTTASPDTICVTSESHDLRWFPLEEAYALTSEPSMHRMFDKLLFLSRHRA